MLVASALYWLGGETFFCVLLFELCRRRVMFSCVDTSLREARHRFVFAVTLISLLGGIGRSLYTYILPFLHKLRSGVHLIQKLCCPKDSFRRINSVMPLVFSTPVIFDHDAHYCSIIDLFLERFISNRFSFSRAQMPPRFNKGGGDTARRMKAEKQYVRTLPLAHNCYYLALEIPLTHSPSILAQARCQGQSCSQGPSTSRS